MSDVPEPCEGAPAGAAPLASTAEAKAMAHKIVADYWAGGDLVTLIAAALSSPPSAPAASGAPPTGVLARFAALTRQDYKGKSPAGWLSEEIERVMLAEPEVCGDPPCQGISCRSMHYGNHQAMAGAALQAVLKYLGADEARISPQASAPESAPRAASAPAMAPAAGEETAREHYAKIAEECAGAKFAAECCTETHNMACESIAQAIRQCDHVPAPGASRAPADAAGTCIFCSIWDRYTQGILMAWSERAEDDDEREEIVAWRQKVRTLATRAPASASSTSSDPPAAGTTEEE